MSFSLQQHQVKAVDDLDYGKILIGDVGSGKSITSMAFFNAKDKRKPIKVFTTAKKRDSGEWISDAMKMGLTNPIDVYSWNSIKDHVDTRDSFIIFDEQKVAGQGAWVDAFYVIARNNPWILLSATPADEWKDLIPVFVANGFFKSKAEFDEYHVRWARFVKYPKIDKYLDEWHLEDLKKKIYVEMPLVKKAERVEHIVNVGFNLYEQKRIWTDRWHIYEDRPIKDAGEMMRLLRRSTNTDFSRYEALKRICTEQPRVIVFYNENPELEQLRGLAEDLGVTVAEWNGHKHEPIPQTERWVYLVQYLAGREGWNCIDTDTVVLYSLPYAYRSVRQAFGRVDRMDTLFTSVHMYILKSRSIIDIAIWRSLGVKKDFQAGRFSKRAWPKEEAPRTKLN